MPNRMTMADGARISPIKAAKAPRGPRNFIPSATDRLMMLPPGRNWHRPSRSVNSAPLSQPCFSTTMRRARGSAPPKAVRPSMRKPVNNCPQVGGGRLAASRVEGAAFMG
ncbi:hypothetical protein D3C73_1339640 [compost metagenome]